MGSIKRFVKADRVRLPLSGDDWIEIKRELTIGELKRVQTAGFTGLRPEGEGRDAQVMIQWHEVELARAEAYLLAWSFTDEDDHPVPLTRAAIESLNEHAFKEISEAIKGHLEQSVRPTT